RDEGRKVRASYYFEATVAPRGGAAYRLSERRKETFSAVLRGYDELCRPKPGEQPRWPVLFSVFLDTRKITAGRTLVFSLELAVSATGYEVDGLLWNDIEIPGEDLYHELLTLRATPAPDGWRLRYNRAYSEWGESRGRDVQKDEAGWYIPLATKKGF